MTPSRALFRLKFPALRRWAYLNSASGGPIPTEVARAAFSSYDSLLQNGDVEWEAQAAGHEEARRNVAALLGCTPRELAFTRNTSHGASLVAQMLWEAGARRVVAFEDEFPSSTLPFLHRGFEVHFVARGSDDDLEARLRTALEGRDVLVASHVMYATGAVQDLALLARAAEPHGAIVVACVTQSLGALACDFRRSGVHFAIGTSHKWLCGGYGGGFLAMREELLGKLHWPQVGWMSVPRPGKMVNDSKDFTTDARALEMGCAPFPVILSLGAAARMWLDAEPLVTQARVRALTRSLRQKLRAAGYDAPHLPESALSGITTVAVDNALLVAQQLREQDVAVSARGAGIRFAVHAFNEESDLERGVAALVASAPAESPTRGS